jgi:hypothetical protein
MVEEKMRYILTLALFFTCLPAASAADDPLTKRNNDAWGKRVPDLAPPIRRPVVAPAPGDSGPTK